MNSPDINQFSRIMTGLAENFNAEISDAGMEMRFRALEKFSIEQIEDAALNLVRHRKFNSMPNTAEFFDFLEGAPEDMAMIEASKVLEAVKMHGGHDSVAFDNPVTQAVILQNFGGWEKLCTDLTGDQEKWFLKDFIKAYQAFMRQGVKIYGQLPGTIERINMAAGYDRKVIPKLIGNQAAALQIAQTPNDNGGGAPNIKMLVGGIGN